MILNPYIVKGAGARVKTDSRTLLFREINAVIQNTSRNLSTVVAGFKFGKIEIAYYKLNYYYGWPRGLHTVPYIAPSLSWEGFLAWYH